MSQIIVISVSMTFYKFIHGYSILFRCYMWVGLGWMVIIGYRLSKSTFGADKQMLQKVFCSNIAPSLSSGNHLVCKAEYMGRSCHRQVWAITFDWSTLVTWNKPSWTAFWKPFSGIPLPPFMSPGREHLAPGNWGARCGHPAKTWQVSYPCKELSKCCSGRLISGR